MLHLIQTCLSSTLNCIQHARTECRRVVVYIRQIPRIMLDRDSTVIRLRAGTSGVGIAAGARDSVASGSGSTQPPTKRVMGVVSRAGM